MIEVLSTTRLNNISGALLLGTEYLSEITLSIGDIDPEDLGLEIVMAQQNKEGRSCLKKIFAYHLKECKDGVATYECDIVPDRTGVYQTALRLFAKNDLLPHRQDFELVKWL